MLLVVLAAFLRWTLAARKWSSRKLGPPSPVDDGSVEVKGALREAVQPDVLIPHCKKDCLPTGESDRIVDSLRAEHLGFAPPGWLALGNSVLISLGLVGTFLGLTVGLFKAVPLITQEDPQLVKEGMDALLDGARLAFVKSLAGLVLALPWSLRYREIEVRWEEHLDGWRRWLNEEHPPLSQERLLAFLLLRHEKEHGELLEAVRGAAGSVATALGTDLKGRGEELRGHLSEQLKPIAGGLQDLLEHHKKASTDLIATVPQATGQVTRAINRLAAEQVSLRQLVDRHAAQLPLKIGTAVSESLHPQAERLRCAVEEVQEAIGQLGESLPDQMGAAFLSQLGSRLEDIQKAIADFRKALSTDLAAELQPSLDRLNGSIDTLSGAGEIQIREAVEAGAGEAVRALSQNLTEVSEKLVELGGKMETGADNAAKRLEEGGVNVSLRLALTASALVGGAEQISGSASDLVDALAEAKTVANSLKDAGKETATELRELAGPVRSAADDFRTAAATLQNLPVVLEDARDALRDAAGALDDAATGLRDERDAAKLLLDSTTELTGQVSALHQEGERIAGGVIHHTVTQTPW